MREGDGSEATEGNGTTIDRVTAQGL